MHKSQLIEEIENLEKQKEEQPSLSYEKLGHLLADNVYTILVALKESVEGNAQREI